MTTRTSPSDALCVTMMLTIMTKNNNKEQQQQKTNPSVALWLASGPLASCPRCQQPSASMDPTNTIQQVARSSSRPFFFPYRFWGPKDCNLEHRLLNFGIYPSKKVRRQSRLRCCRGLLKWLGCIHPYRFCHCCNIVVMSDVLSLFVWVEVDCWC